MARYENGSVPDQLTDAERELELEEEDTQRSVIINLASVISALLVSAAIVGGLVWLNILIWGSIF
jgi:hypothetical protein